ncbi:hypothetical protein WN944_007910 [Citrus x changshan-huyou]|uniref:Uncharacterized protein n=1 Tax=Citrus x changshan-huyou TaxID=2935761 RepID=A0AAP0MP81_9ROSI
MGVLGSPSLAYRYKYFQPRGARLETVDYDEILNVKRALEAGRDKREVTTVPSFPTQSSSKFRPPLLNCSQNRRLYRPSSEGETTVSIWMELRRYGSQDDKRKLQSGKSQPLNVLKSFPTDDI